MRVDIYQYLGSGCWKCGRKVKAFSTSSWVKGEVQGQKYYVLHDDDTIFCTCPK